MTKQQILDFYFLDARHKLVELAAFLDRMERADGEDDFRLESFRAALGELTREKKGKAKSVLLAFSEWLRERTVHQTAARASERPLSSISGATQ